MWSLTELTEWLRLRVFLKTENVWEFRRAKGLYRLGFHNVAVRRINEVAASTRFSYKRFALIKK